MTDNTNGVRLALLTAAIYVAASTVGLRLFYYLSYVLAAVLVSAFIWSRANRAGLSVKRTAEPKQAQVGQIVQETVEVTNSWPLGKLWLEVRDRSTLPGHKIGAVISMRGRSVRRWQAKTRCLKRGLYRLGPTVVASGDPFGLFGVGRAFESQSELLVYPSTVPLQQFGVPTAQLPGGNRTERRSYQSSPNAAGIREYIPGDSMSRIHWPASARLQHLMVKEFELDPTSDLWLVLDLEEAVHYSLVDEEAYPFAPEKPLAPPLSRRRARDNESAATERAHIALEPSTEEYAVAVTASLASYFLSEGKSVGLVGWGQHKVTVSADRGGRQLTKILRALAVLRAEGSTPLQDVLMAEGRQFGRHDSLVVVTPSIDEKWVPALQLQRPRIAGAVAVLIEPASFGGPQNAVPIVGSLSSIDIPVYVVKRDDSIDAALGQEYGSAAARNLR